MRTVADLIDRNANWYPRAEAFVMGEQRRTYGDYAARCRRLSHGLFSLGVRSQDRVGILSTNNIEYFEVFGACELAGYIVGLYNFRSAPPEVAYLLKDSAPTLVIFESQFAEMIDSLRGQFPGIRHWVCIGPGTPEWALDFESVVAGGDPGGAPLRAEPEYIAYLFYTSGTTGTPKGVPWSQAAALNAARNEGRTQGSGTRLLQLAPAFHTGGKGFPLGAMWLASTVVLDQPGFDARRFLELVERERITETFMVPMMIQAAIEELERKSYDLSSLRNIMAASTAIPAPLLERALARFGPVFYTAYGSTEGGSITLLMKHEMLPTGSADDLKRLSSVGHFQPEIEGTILDESDQPCAVNQVGEVCVKSNVFQGYWNNDIATLESTRNGWFHTGDVGYQDEEGFVFLVDRKKDMIISGGENIYSREVEDAIHRHPAVREVAVIGIPDDKWGEVVMAVVVLRQGEQLDEVQLIDHCRTQIARYKCPHSVAFVDALPLMGTSKIDKIALRKRYASSGD